MEVDLTDDDMIITGPLPPAKAPTPKGQAPKAPPSRASISRGPAPKPPSVKLTPAASSVETVDITEDDDIIFETDAPSKGQNVEKTPPATRPVQTSSGSQSKPAAGTDKMEVDDDVIELLDDPCPSLPVKESFQVPVAAFQPSNVTRKSLSKHPSNDNQVEMDDVIEVVDAPQASKGKTNDVEIKNMTRLSNLLPDISKKTSEPTSTSSSKNRLESDDVIEVVEAPSAVFAKPLPPPAPAITAKHLLNVSETRYVVDISEDDDSLKRSKRKTENTCLNANCMSGEGLVSATMSVMSYFGSKLKKGKSDVCAACLEKVIENRTELIRRVRAGESLYTYDNFPKNDIPVVDLESDEELSENEDPLPYRVLQDVDANIEQAIDDCFTKYDINYQLQEATGFLSSKLANLEMGAKIIDENYDKLQKEIDDMRREIYKPHNSIIKELPSLDLDDIPVFKPPFPAQPIKIEQPAPIPLRGVAIKKVTSGSTNRASPTRSDVSSLDVVALEQVRYEVPPLPPVGNLVRPKPRIHDMVYVMKMSCLGVWLKGRVVEVINSPFPNKTLYKVRMEIQGTRKQIYSFKTVSGVHMAYPNPAQVRLTVGVRVIAVFQDDENSGQSKGGSYYSGIIAEPPKSNNRYRYLVFFDDGYAQYVYHNKILVVCESSTKVYDDIYPESREFIKDYLSKYPERPMVKLAANQVVKTEWNGKWWIARVVEVDGSLVKMSFDADKRTEWIYRGSTRLAPLFTELAQKQARQESGSGGFITRMRGMGVRRMNQPYVEYTQNLGAEDEPQAAVPATTVRAVAKKSTSKKQETLFPHIQTPRASFFNPENIGVVKELQLPKDAPMPIRYRTHSCTPLCLQRIKYDPDEMREYNPLSIPLYCGWQRELPKFKKKSTIMYTAPCGRRLRSMEELHKYLQICKSNMSVDLFDFDYWVNALSEFTLSDKIKKYIVKEDMTDGKENVKIPLVNYIDHSLPSNLIYMDQRTPYDESVNLNTKPEFLCGCDCTDDCRDKDKCACWQLTVQGSSLYPGGEPDPNVGYYYKRLQERVITGIYECNDQCKCSKKTCLNRVVQHKLQLQLQLFKTQNKGWGLRCLNDIPKGTFICIYAGYLYTEQTANLIGGQEGDDYLAELDYIEVVERMKEDYESDVEEEEEEEDDVEEEKRPQRLANDRRSRDKNKDEADSDFKIGWRSSSDKSTDSTIRTRLRKRSAADLDSNDGDKTTKKRDSSDADGDEDGSDDDKMERLPSSFTPKQRKPQNIVEKPVHRFQSVRKFYGPNERVYIMDANKVGNVGRYLNHSCSPNVFVQNVFVDTHDLRFPWVAFFALTYIKAGTELTWDYNYDVGSVPDKTIFCRCGSDDCRGRLL